MLNTKRKKNSIQLNPRAKKSVHDGRGRGGEGRGRGERGGVSLKLLQ
jgi:hypothetical protein